MGIHPIAYSSDVLNGETPMNRLFVGSLILISSGCRMCSDCCDYLPPVLDGPFEAQSMRAGSRSGRTNGLPAAQAVLGDKSPEDAAADEVAFYFAASEETAVVDPAPEDRTPEAIAIGAALELPRTAESKSLAPRLH